MPSFLRNGILLNALVACATVGRASDVPWNSPSFIDSISTGASGVAVGDINRDGKLDVVAISAGTTVEWHEQGGGAHGVYAPRAISTGLSSPQRVRLADMDGDGWLDVIVTSSGTGSVRIFFNDKTPSDGGWVGNTWATAFGDMTGLAVADFDKDGDNDLAVSAPSLGRVAWLENDGTPRSGSATMRDLTLAIGDQATDLDAADLNRDGFADVVASNGPGGLSGSGVVFWLNDQTPTAGWTRTVVVSGQASSFNRILAADVNGDNYADVVAGRADGTIVWFRSTGAGTFASATLGTGVGDPRGLAVGDIDGDSDNDVVVASFSTDAVRWFDNSGGLTPAFTSRVTASSQDGASGVGTGDEDNDGDTDVFFCAANIGRVALSRNTKVHMSHQFEPFVTLSSENIGRRSRLGMDTADIDNDGDIDVAVSRRSMGGGQVERVWFEHDATPFSGTWTARSLEVIETNTFLKIDLVDAEGDGDFDLAAQTEFGANFKKVGFFVNDGTPSSGGWAEVDDTYVNLPYNFEAADLDGDGDCDILCRVIDLLSADQHLEWLEHRPASADRLVSHVINVDVEPPSYLAVTTGDLDRDGDRDIVVVSDDGPCWFENPGALSGVFLRRVLGPASVTAGAREAPVIVDFDHDGLSDVLLRSASGATIMRNLGGTPPTFSAVPLPGSPGGSPSFVSQTISYGDCDRDGDVDLLLASDDSVLDQRDFAECTNAGALTFATTRLFTTGVLHFAEEFADLDSDGLLDIVAVAHPNDDGVETFSISRNRGGQAKVSAAPAIPFGSGIFDGNEGALLDMTFRHLGRAGDHSAELAEVRVLFEQLPGLSLTPSQVAALFTSVAVWRDANGNGTLEPAVDVLVDRTIVNVVTATNPVVLSITDGLADAQVAATSSRDYLISVAVRPDAHSAAVSSFMALLRLDSDGGAVAVNAEDIAVDLPLRLAHSFDARSPLVRTLCRADFNGDGFLDFFDVDEFVLAFEAGEPESDFNRDGFVDFFDADEFTQAFENGC